MTTPNMQAEAERLANEVRNMIDEVSDDHCFEHGDFIGLTQKYAQALQAAYEAGRDAENADKAVGRNLAFEYGYKCCEKGMNLEAAFEALRQTEGEKK